MRALISYGVAGAVLVAGALWLGSGMLVTGGKGPGLGEKPIVELLSQDTAALDPAQQALADAAAAKAKEAAEAKARSDEAAAAAAKAQTEAASGPASKLQEELAKEAATKAKEAAEAKAKADEAAEAAKVAEEEAAHVQEKLDATKSIAERQALAVDEVRPAQSVRTETYAIKPMAIEVPLRGRTKAKASVTVMPETQGIVEQVHVEKGQAVAAGDLICTLDEGTRAAAVAQAEAALAQAQTGYDSNAALREKGLAAANTGNQFEAALKAAQAALDNARAELERTQVKTQVAGVVQDPLAQVGSMLGAGSPCATVVQLDPMLFTAAVTEARVGYAKLGLPATITTITGQTVEGKVSFIASTADPATRSFAVEIQIPNASGKVLDGITAEAVVNVGTAPAHLLPQSVLTLDDEGVLGVRAVGADSKVAFYPVTIMKDTREGVWVTGLPPKVDIITLGQEFVTAGETVNATNVTKDTASTEVSAEGVQS
jgi:multidrug efflux system membrane fusion protein